MENRKKALELFAKQLREGIPYASDFIEGDNDIENNALLARNLSEQTLANEVMKNTGIPVPDKGASVLKKEDFLNRIMKERYPELEPNIQIKDIDGSAGTYHKGKIELNKWMLENDPIEKTLGTTLHEAGHQYDDQILKHQGKELDLKTLRDLKKSGFDLKNADPAQVYEMYAKNHHANIPNLREGTFGLGALKSYLKNGTFKSLPAIGTGMAAYAALESGDASAAVPGLDQADNVGMSSEDERQMLAEHDARVNYDKSQARRDALMRLKNGR